MWNRQSHLLQPLTELRSNKVSFKWTDIEQKAFYDIKRVFYRDTLLSYPHFNKLFDIHMDASNFQIGTVISQGGKPIDFYS